ncbi:MAG TPA: malonyl-ACP O-methyltransferase BioC [Usitatibacter sp.]|nr:malonyl-ACP O-methyltransferase BioC [Usitatibacter sp.]
MRRSFERAAATYDHHNVLQCEIGLRLLKHLDPIRLDPKTLVDVGCGTGLFFDELRKRFPGRDMVGVDIALPMLMRARSRTPWWRKVARAGAPQLIAADAERLPLATACCDFVFSNLALQWCRPEAVFAEAARILRPGGLFLFSSFGPDTLKELRASFAAVDGYDHVNTFVDMHDLGDALVHAGLADPVMEMEMITLEYACVEAIARDLKAIGARNALPGRPRGLSGRERWRGVIAGYEKHRRDGILPASYEVIYGHAWKTAPKRLADGRQVIDFQREAR